MVERWIIFRFATSEPLKTWYSSDPISRSAPPSADRPPPCRGRIAPRARPETSREQIRARCQRSIATNDAPSAPDLEPTPSCPVTTGPPPAAFAVRSGIYGLSHRPKMEPPEPSAMSRWHRSPDRTERTMQGRGRRRGIPSRVGGASGEAPRPPTKTVPLDRLSGVRRRGQTTR